MTMTDEVFEQLTAEAHKALQANHLHDALYLINMLLKDLQIPEVITKGEQLEDGYQHMLRFIAQAGLDEQAAEVHADMSQKAYALLVFAERQYRLNKNKSAYARTALALAETVNSFQHIYQSFIEIASETKEREEALDKLFLAIWTSINFTKEDTKFVRSLLDFCNETEDCIIISALTLSLMEYLDPEKLNLLTDALANECDKVRIRAAAGISFVALQHSNEIQIYRKAVASLQETLSGNDDIQQLFIDANQAYILCLQSEQAHKRLQKEILPNIMKLSSDLHDKMGFEDLHELLSDEEESALKPNNNKERDSLRKSVQKMFDMEQEGLDLHVGNIIVMRNHEFFKSLPHWLLPFDSTRTEVKELCDNKDESADLVGSLMEAMGHGYCDTDRYGLLFLMNKSLPKDMRKNLAEHIQVNIQDADGNPISFDPKKIKEILPVDNRQLTRRYMQQLYRVWTKSNFEKEWKKNFEYKVDWLNNSILFSVYKNNTAGLRMLADTLLKYEYYAEAESYLQQLIKLEGSDAETLRSAAYCKQKLGQYGTALTLYSQADMLQPEHVWTLMQMQLCYARLEKHEQRLDCLLQIEQLQPDNSKVITETGLCLIQMRRWQEAAQRFYRLEYEEYSIIPAQRAIAWCSLNQGKTEAAQRYYEKLLSSSSATWQDYLNAGHTAWIAGNTKDAVEKYHGYIKRYLTDDPKITDAMTPFLNDTNLLLSLGKKQGEIDIMHDLVQCTIHNS